ncbi:transcriptional repressor [Altererythrobacter sp. N1]|nr:transcriptional repressor [Altererythrobacter sp. N1]
MGAETHHTLRRTRAQNDALVLDLLHTAARPVSAYEIADMARNAGVSLVPNQVYRTMARLLEDRQVRRVETLNAYLPWVAADLCLVCGRCRAVELIELPSLGTALAKPIAEARFHPSTFVVEMLGRCARCELERQPE